MALLRYVIGCKRALYLVLCLMALLRYVIACKRALYLVLCLVTLLRYVIACKIALSGSLSNDSFKICYCFPIYIILETFFL